MIRRDDARRGDGDLARTVEDRHENLLVGRAHRRDDIEKGADVEGFGHALALQQAAFDQDGVVHVEAVHRQDLGAFALGLQRLGQRVGQRRFAGPGRAGNRDEEALRIAGASR